jgi:hypothetical protein
MKLDSLVKAGFTLLFATSTLFIAQAAGQNEIAKVREATARFQRTPAARAAGYDLLLGFDDCLQNYGVGGTGYHYINTDLLDITVDWLHPEALVYAPDANGSLQFGAIEYIVPAAVWDAEHTQPPHVLDQSFHLNERLGMYVLYAWIWKKNPSGTFEDWNPDVSCPEPHNGEGSMRWRQQLEIKNK